MLLTRTQISVGHMVNVQCDGQNEFKEPCSGMQFCAFLCQKIVVTKIIKEKPRGMHLTKIYDQHLLCNDKIFIETG